MFIVFNNLTLVSDYPGMLLKFAPCNLLSQLDIIESETLPTLRGHIRKFHPGPLTVSQNLP